MRRKPFQHTAFLEAKKFDKQTITIGYLHSLLTPLPCDFFYRSGAPDFAFSSWRIFN